MLELVAFALMLTAGTLLLAGAFPRRRNPDNQELDQRRRLVKAMKDQA